MLCKKCVLPESKPDIFLNAEGVCNVCLEFEKAKGAIAKPLETDFVKLLKQNQGKGEYDCLVMCSGGKDSTAALYYMKKRYNAKTLAFTFDHGFETEGALENIRNAVEILGVDFLFFRTNFMRDMFAKIIATGSKAVICHLCSLWYMELTLKMAARFKVPIIIAGWTKGQSTKQAVTAGCNYSSQQTEFIAMAKATQEFLEKHVRTDPQYKDFPRSMEEVLKRAEKTHKSMVLSPHWFLPDTAEVYAELIKKELKWQPTPVSYPANSTNCYLNFLSSHHAIKNFGYTHYHVEMSKMIREGLLLREDALKFLEADFDKDVLKSVTGKLGCAYDA